MANIAEDFRASFMAGLDEELAKMDKKFEEYTKEFIPEKESILDDCGRRRDEMKVLEAEISDLLEADKQKKMAEVVEQEAHEKENLFKSTIGPDNPKSLHELYEEMDLLVISSDDDDDKDDDKDSGNEDEVEDDDEDEIIFLGATQDEAAASKKRTANQARLTPPDVSLPKPTVSAQIVGNSASPQASRKPQATVSTAAKATLPPSPGKVVSISASPSPQKLHPQPQQPLQQGSATRQPVQQNRAVTLGQSGRAVDPGQNPTSLASGHQQTVTVSTASGQQTLTLPPGMTLQSGQRLVGLTTPQGQRTFVLRQPVGGVQPTMSRPQTVVIQQGNVRRVVIIQPQRPQAAPKAVPIAPASAQTQRTSGVQQPPQQPLQPRVLSAGTSSEVVEILDDDDEMVVGTDGKMVRKSTMKPPDLDPNKADGGEKPAEDDATLPELVEGKRVLAKGEANFWFPAVLTGPTILHKDKKKYKVQFEQGRKRLLSSKNLAVVTPSRPGDLAVGIRVVASYIVETGTKAKGMYAGIISEVPMKTNRGRYLVFFDDGYTQYLSCDMIHIVYHSSALVWADVDTSSRTFIKDYLDKYPERPMVNLKSGQTVQTEWHGKWWNAKVLEVQGSLANMLFEEGRKAETEWIYRGSTRIKPLLDLGERKNLGVGMGPTPEQIRLNLPYVEMTKVHSDHILPEQQIPQPKPTMLGRLNDPNLKYSEMLKQCAQQSMDEVRTQPSSESQDEEQRRKKKKKKKNRHRERRKDIYEEDKEFEPAGTATQTTLIKVERKKYNPHLCCRDCITGSVPKDVVQTLIDRNPLLWPMLLGWVRELCKQGGSSYKRYVIYRSPCGRSLCSFDDINRYLRETRETILSVDRFSFDPFVHISINQRRTRQNSRFYYMHLHDLSNGMERVPVSCVNEYDTDEPPPLKYMTERQAVQGTKVNRDPNFLVCCDCVNNCADSKTCACRRLTVDATTANRGGKAKQDAGYKNRLLFDPLQTGIYECNDRCKCNRQCQNKVVQNGLSLRLQVFKTLDRGWGIRCLDDIPRGMFVCTYTGQIWSEEEADEKGKDHGDEYFAELDYIEIVEGLKEGYESDVDPIDEDMSEKDSDEEDSTNGRTQSSSEDEEGDEEGDEEADEGQTAQSELSSDDSADIVNPVYRRAEEKTTAAGATSDGGGGGTRLVLRRQSENTEQNEWSVSLASSGAKKETAPSVVTAKVQGPTGIKPEGSKVTPNVGPSPIKYGYDPNPSKEFLDSKKLEAFRSRKQAEKAARQRLSLSSENDIKEESKPSKDKEEKDSDMDIVDLDCATPSTSNNSSNGAKMATKIADLALTDKDGRPKKEAKDEGKEEEDEEEKEKKSKQRVVMGPRARKSTNARRHHHGYSPGAAATEVKNEKEIEDENDGKVSTRHFFDERECYVMDAKHMGNLGRYLNHSCRPNLFVQNIFVDTHDLRFPWIAFFATTYIRAGQELTWDYNYNVGSVPGKEIKCLCKNVECRGRLL